MNDQALANVYSHLYAVFMAFLSELGDRIRSAICKVTWYDGVAV